MSPELGQSSAARDDSDDSEATEATEADDAAAESGAPRRSVLAPFMITGSADDSLPEEDSDEEDEASGAPDEAFADAVSNDRPDEAPQRGDAVSPAVSDVDSVTVEAPEDNETPATPGAATRAAATADPATAAAGGIPAARSVMASPDGSTGPRIESGGPEQAAADMDGPLLEDSEELRTTWLRLQAGFVDDPHEAVSDAADLVEHTAQALVGALRQRQQKLREMWDGGRPKGSGSADADADGPGAGPAAADTTEQLRLLMQRYRVLFNHICRS